MALHASESGGIFKIASGATGLAGSNQGLFEVGHWSGRDCILRAFGAFVGSCARAGETTSLALGAIAIGHVGEVAGRAESHASVVVEEVTARASVSCRTITRGARAGLALSETRLTIKCDVGVNELAFGAETGASGGSDEFV